MRDLLRDFAARRRHRAAVQPPARRGAGDGRPARRHRRRADRRRRRPRRPARRPGTLVRGLDPAALAGALRAAGSRLRRPRAARLRVDATAEQVGRVAAAGRQVLLELRDGDAPAWRTCSSRSPRRRPTTARLRRPDRSPATARKAIHTMTTTAPTLQPRHRASHPSARCGSPRCSRSSCARLPTPAADVAARPSSSALSGVLGWTLDPPGDERVVRQLRRRRRRRRRLPRPDHRTAGDDGRVDATHRADHLHARAAPRPVLAAKFVAAVVLAIAILAVGIVLAVAHHGDRRPRPRRRRLRRPARDVRAVRDHRRRCR